MGKGRGILWDIGEVTPGTVKAQNAEFFGTDLSPASPDSVTNKGAKFRITLSLSAAVVVQVTLDGGTRWHSLFGGTNLTANSMYDFGVSVRDGDTFNMRISTAGGATVNLCRIDEFNLEA